MALEGDLKNKGSSRWIKGCFGYRCLGHGLIRTVDQVIKDHCDTFIQTLKNSKCTACSTNTLLPDHDIPPKGHGKQCAKGRRHCFCLMNVKYRQKCPNNFCSAVYDKIVDSHRYRDPNWANTDITKWGTSYVEIAKCFIPTNGYRNKEKLQDIDCSGLLQIILNNIAFDVSLTQMTTSNPLQVFTKAKTNRNTLFHSPDMELTEDQLRDMFDNMIGILQMPGIIDTDGEATKSIQKLEQLKTDDISLSQKDEIDIRREVLQDIETKLEDMAAEFKQLENDLTHRVKDQTDQCKKDITRLQENTSEKFDRVDTDIKTLEKICKDLESKHTVSEESPIVRLQTLTAEMASTYPEQSSEQTVSEKRVHDLCIYLSNQLDRYHENEKEVSGMSALVSSQKQELHYLQRLQDLQKQVCDYYSECLSTIPVSPVLKVISGSVNELFVEQSLIEDVDNADIETPRQVSSFEDLFVNGEEHYRNIYIIGEPGVGKTTWCKHILSTWVRACTEDCYCETLESNVFTSATGIEVSKRNEQFLSQFRVLFYIALRQESQHTNIIDMIKDLPVVREYSLQATVDEAFQRKLCLVVLDGLDEWTPQVNASIPGRDGLYGCPIITTSRPYKLSGIYNDTTFVMDRKVKITGIRDKESLAANVIKQLNRKLNKNRTSNEESDRNDARAFIEDINAMKDRAPAYRKNMPSVMNVPLVLIIMACLWYDKRKFEDTLTKNLPNMIEFIIRYAESSLSEGFSKMKWSETISELKKKWSKHADELPPLLRKNDKLREYSELILKISELAFHSLCNTEYESRLTFTKDDLLKYVSKEELGVVFKIGILSESEVTTSPLYAMTKVSFIHKLFHEYLAAIYVLAQFKYKKPGNIDMLKTYVADPDVPMVHDIGNVVCFVGGVDPIIGSEMSVYLFKDFPFELHVKHRVPINDLLLRQIQVVYENDERFPNVQHPIYTEYIYAPTSLSPQKMNYLCILLNTNQMHLKHVEIPFEFGETLLIQNCDREKGGSFSLCIYNICPIEYCNKINEMLRCVPKVQELSLHGIRTNLPSRSTKPHIDLTGCHSLQILTLKDFSASVILLNSPLKTFKCDHATGCELYYRNRKRYLDRPAEDGEIPKKK